MADSIIKASSEMSALIPELWSADFYPTLVAKLPMIELVDMSYEGQIQSLGDTVNISSFPEFGAATDLAEDQNNDAQGITVSSTPLVINKQIVQDFIVTRKALLQSISAVEELNKGAMYSVMKKIQSLILAEISPSSSSPDHIIPYDSGTTLALADILEAKELLDAANVDESNRKMVLGSAAVNDLFNITGFVSRDYVPAGSPLSNGQFNVPLAGFEVRSTTVVSTTSYFFHPSFMTMAIQELPNVEVFNLGSVGARSTRVNLTSLLGIKQLGSTRVVSIA